MGYDEDKKFLIQKDSRFVSLKIKSMIDLWSKIKKGMFSYFDLKTEFTSDRRFTIKDLNLLLSKLIEYGLLKRCKYSGYSIYEAVKDLKPISQGYGLGHIAVDSPMYVVLQNNTKISITKEELILWSISNGICEYQNIIMLAEEMLSKDKIVIPYDIEECLGLATLTCLSKGLLDVI